MIVGKSRLRRGAGFANGSPGLLGDVVAPIVSATRWRMLTRNRPNNGYIWIGELRLLSEEGGSQLAVDGSTGTASANSNSGAGYAAAGAFNNNLTDNGWSSAQFGSPQENWIEFEFDVATTVNAFSIHSKSVSAYGPLDFDIQYHDGTDWVVAGSYDLTTGDYTTSVYAAVL